MSVTLEDILNHPDIRREVTEEEIISLPKIMLHCHLDGSLRPQTIIDIFTELNRLHELPSTNPVELLDILFDRCCSSLLTYLSCFEITIACLQSYNNIKRISKELAEDLRNDGICYAEVRYDPCLSTREGLEINEVIQAIADGFREVSSIEIRIILSHVRTAPIENAKKILNYLSSEEGRKNLCVSGDLAGAENGFPSELYHEEFLKPLKDNSIPYTIHAGEDYGAASIKNSVVKCGALRIGHGIRIIDDIEKITHEEFLNISTIDDEINHIIDDLEIPSIFNEKKFLPSFPCDKTCSTYHNGINKPYFKKLTSNYEGIYKLGKLSQYLITNKIPLEICVTSNLQTLFNSISNNSLFKSKYSLDVFSINDDISHNLRKW